MSEGLLCSRVHKVIFAVFEPRISVPFGWVLFFFFLLFLLCFFVVLNWEGKGGLRNNFLHL